MDFPVPSLFSRGLVIWKLVSASTGRVIDWSYSERGPVAELDPSLASEVDALLAGILIETAPGVPAR